jgi:hypothetical protein
MAAGLTGGFSAAGPPMGASPGHEHAWIAAARRPASGVEGWLTAAMILVHSITRF